MGGFVQGKRITSDTTPDEIAEEQYSGFSIRCENCKSKKVYVDTFVSPEFVVVALVCAECGQKTTIVNAN